MYEKIEAKEEKIRWTIINWAKLRSNWRRTGHCTSNIAIGRLSVRDQRGRKREKRDDHLWSYIHFGWKNHVTYLRSIFLEKFIHADHRLINVFFLPNYTMIFIPSHIIFPFRFVILIKSIGLQRRYLRLYFRESSRAIHLNNKTFLVAVFRSHERFRADPLSSGEPWKTVKEKRRRTRDLV